MRAANAIQLKGGRFLLPALTALFVASPTFAVDRYYTGPSGGEWLIPGSWNTRANGSGSMGLPLEGDILFVQRTANTTVNFNIPYASPQYAGLYLDGLAGAEVSLVQSADSISADFEVVALG